MQMRKFCLGATFAVMMLSGCNAAHHHEAKDEVGEGNEVKVPIAEVPEPVRVKFADVSHGMKVDALDKEVDNGETIYEGDAVIDGQNYEIKIDPSGRLISKMADNEEAEKGDKGNGKHEDKD
jgi:hypothetical protein